MRRLAAIVLLVLAVNPLLLGDEDADRREAAAFLDRAREAFRGEDPAGLVDLFDFDRAWREVRAVFPDPATVDRGRDEVRRVLPDLLVRATEPLPWDEHSIVRLRVGPAGTEATLVSTHRIAEGGGWRLVWRLSRSGAGPWRFFDFVEACQRASLTSFLAGAIVATRADAERTPSGRLCRVLGASDSYENPESLVRALVEFRKVKLPPALDAVRHFLLGMEWSRLGDPGEALDHLERSLATGRAPPGTEVWRAHVLSRLGRHAEALVAAGWFLDAVGDDDPQGLLQKGVALAGLGRTEEALAALGAGIDGRPYDRGCLVEFGDRLPEDGKAELGRRFLALADPEAEFPEIADALLDRNDVAAVQALVTAYRTLRPKDPEADYWQTAALGVEGRHEEAAKLLLAALPRMPDHLDLERFEELYLDEMFEADRPLSGYLALRGSSAAFEYVAERFRDPWAPEKLLALAELHAESAPGDPLTPLYRDEALGRLGDHDAAEKVLIEGWRGTEPGALRERFRAALVDNRFLEDWGLSALDDFGPREWTFGQLADLYWDYEEKDRLAELAAKHEKVMPRDPRLRLVRIDIAWLSGDWEAVVAGFDAAGSAFGTDDDTIWKYESLLLQSLVRLGRLDRALALAKTVDERENAAWFLAVAHLARGEEAPALTAIERMLATGWTVDDLYADEELGRLLREKPPPAITKRWPAPK